MLIINDCKDPVFNDACFFIFDKPVLKLLVHHQQAWSKEIIHMSWIHFDDCIVLHPFEFACSPYWSLWDGSSGPIVG